MPDRPPPDPFLVDLQESLKGRYSIECELGRGGMGIVYLAREVVLDRPVALKVLPPELARQPTFRERFLREARTAARLSHPHIVPIHAVDEAGEFVFFAMAYIEGETLGERVRGRGPLPPAEAARILREVAWALGYAHAQNVVHRDVKPDNILLEADTGRALVMDFGIAGVMSVHSSGHTSEVVGTVEFMSPEQASGEPADGRGDLYSLGVVGHYALTGRLPFQGETAAATLAQHLTRPAPPVHAVAPGVPAPLVRALDRCLAKDPDARFASGEDLASALGGALQREKEVPKAIRAFLEETRAQGVTLTTSLAWGAWTGAWTVGGIALGEPAWVTAGIGAFAAGFLLAPAGILIQKARKLLRSGHEHDELVRVLADEVRDRRTVLAASEAEGPSRLDRWLTRLTWGGAATFAGGFGWLGWGPFIQDPLFWTLYAGIMTGSATAFFGAGFASAIRDSGSKGVLGQRWLRIWESPLGRGIFGIAGTGLDDQDRRPTGPGYRPTSVAIGMAADRLFRELPPTLRQQFPELPSVLEALEADAEAVRAQLEHLDHALENAEPEAGSGAKNPDQAAAIQGTRQARAAAEARLADVVAALESIRLQLIRMHAGFGSAELLTEHLGTARAMARDIQRVADGADVVDALLGSLPPRTTDTPTPTPA